MPDLDLNDLAVFVRVVERGGFAKAARELRVPTSTVSRTVSRLEDRVGAQLLHRSTRTVRPTVEGARLFASIAPAVTTLQEAVRATNLRGREPEGRLRVTAPNDLANTFVSSVILAFVERYPKVEIELELTARKVDLLAEGFDVALRAGGKLDDSSLVARKIGELREQLFAAPSYVQRFGLPTSIGELANHTFILFRAREAEATIHLRGPAGEVSVPVRGRIAGDDYSFVREAVLRGAGLGLIPSVLCKQDLAASRLVRVLSEYEGRRSALYFLHPFTRQVPSKVAAFRDAMIQAFAHCPKD